MPRWIVICVKRAGSGLNRSAEVMPETATKQSALGRANALKAAAAADNVRTSVHLCPHSQNESSETWYDCKNDPRAEYTEV